MTDVKQAQLERFKIETSTKIYCLNAACVNLVPEDSCCNLKRVVINPTGKCAGFIKMVEKKKKKAVSLKAAKSAK